MSKVRQLEIELNARPSLMGQGSYPLHHTWSNVPYLTNKKSKHKDPHQPGTGHKEILGLILRLGVLTDARSGLGGKVETPDVPGVEKNLIIKPF